MLPEMIGTAAAGTEMEADKAEKVDFFGGDASPENSVSAVIKQLGAAVTSEITARDLADALSVAVEEGEMTKEGVSRIAELLMGQASVPGEGLDVETAPSKTEELKSALMSAVDADVDLISKDDLKSAISAMAMSSKETGTTPDEVVDSVEAMPEKQLMAAIDRAKTATATDGRLRARARREFWGVKTASTKNISDNVIGWLADYSTNFGISTRRIAKAAKRLCEEFEVAEKLVAKAVIASERTAGITVTQSKSDCIRFMCRAEDLDGTLPSDSNFDESFKQKAIEVLQGHGFQVDPGTFSFTDLIVSENGDVTATVSTSSSKTFKADEEYAEMNAGMNAEDSSEMPVIMTEGARLARKSRRDDILAKYAQAMPGMGAPAPQGPAAGPVDPGLGGGAPAGGDLGISSLTGGADMNESADMDAMTEPGEKKPWGSVCPVCGADDVNISESNADCQSCGTTYKILQQIELISMGDKGKSSPEEDPMGLGPDTGLGAATAPAELPAPAPAAPGMGPVASDIRTMIRLSATVDSDVYLKTALPSFDRTAESMLPVGMVCPSCGDREAHKVKSNTFCYKCGNYSRTTVQASKKDPSKLDVSITWID
jgi:ssDNA-binding Zn-finger/Zn-ribbon topoisomerase 1